MADLEDPQYLFHSQTLKPSNFKVGVRYILGLIQSRSCSVSLIILQGFGRVGVGIKSPMFAYVNCNN